MQRAFILLSVRHGWLLIIAAGMFCFGASFAILHITNFNLLSLMAALPAKIADSMMLALVGIIAAGAFVIYRLNGQDRLMTAALNNMPQGLCMFDASARLTLCNERYTEIYGLSAEQVMLGSSLRDLLEHCRAMGTFSGDTDQYVTKCTARIALGKVTSTSHELKDGRIIGLVKRPMRGGGWVETLEDITKRRRAALQRSSLQEHEQRRRTQAEAIQEFRERVEGPLKSNTDSAATLRTMASEIDVKATMKKKLDLDFRDYRILGACNPPLAHQALTVDDKIGTMLLCNVIVQDLGGGKIEVAAINPAISMEHVGNPTLRTIAESVTVKLKRVIAAI